MNARFLLASVVAFAVLSWILTFASYFHYVKPFTVDGEIVYRGWPLCWMTESWSYWSPPPYPHFVSYQPVNVLIDFVFYAVIFQVPVQLFWYSSEVREQSQRTENHRAGR